MSAQPTNPQTRAKSSNPNKTRQPQIITTFSINLFSHLVRRGCTGFVNEGAGGGEEGREGATAEKRKNLI